MDSRKCQTATASPAKPGELPIGLDDNDWLLGSDKMHGPHGVFSETRFI
jgi:hypothetical protein